MNKSLTTLSDDTERRIAPVVVSTGVVLVNVVDAAGAIVLAVVDRVKLPLDTSTKAGTVEVSNTLSKSRLIGVNPVINC